MSEYAITDRARTGEKGAAHRNAVHNVVAWGAIRELFRLNEGKPVSGEEIKKALEYCLDAGDADVANRKPNARYFKYVTEEVKWIVEV